MRTAAEGGQPEAPTVGADALDRPADTSGVVEKSDRGRKQENDNGRQNNVQSTCHARDGLEGGQPEPRRTVR